jgi:hypothetical protein
MNYKGYKIEHDDFIFCRKVLYNDDIIGEFQYLNKNGLVRLKKLWCRRGSSRKRNRDIFDSKGS